MRRVSLGFVLGLAVGSAAAQQVWKCEVDGEVRYTDQPCETRGQPLPARSLQPNLVEPLVKGPADSASAAAQAAPPASSAASAGTGMAAAASEPVARPLPSPVRTAARRGKPAPRVAMWGLMDTDFVQRGRPYTRQNPASSPSPP